MEELKVRAKQLDEWVEGYFCVYRGVPQILVDESSWEPIDDIKTVGRYTGLCDKNGNKIFEGDIVQYYGTYPLEVYIEKGHTKIRWYDTISARKYDELFFSIDREGYGECEIIGNIYDNPELLKGGKK